MKREINEIQNRGVKLGRSRSSKCWQELLLGARTEMEGAMDSQISITAFRDEDMREKVSPSSQVGRAGRADPDISLVTRSIKPRSKRSLSMSATNKKPSIESKPSYKNYEQKFSKLADEGLGELHLDCGSWRMSSSS